MPSNWLVFLLNLFLPMFPIFLFLYLLIMMVNIILAWWWWWSPSSINLLNSFTQSLCPGCLLYYHHCHNFTVWLFLLEEHFLSFLLLLPADVPLSELLLLWNLHPIGHVLWLLWDYLQSTIPPLPCPTRTTLYFGQYLANIHPPDYFWGSANFIHFFYNITYICHHFWLCPGLLIRHHSIDLHGLSYHHNDILPSLSPGTSLFHILVSMPWILSQTWYS